MTPSEPGNDVIKAAACRALFNQNLLPRLFNPCPRRNPGISLAPGIGHIVLALLLLLATLAQAGAQPANPSPLWPILDIASVPHLDERGRTQYARFIQTNLPRAFALSPSGKLGWASGFGASIEDVRAKALESCTDKGATDCVLYAENLAIVWPVLAWADTPAPLALISTTTHAFVPDERFLWHGPQAAAGVYVWGHGKAPGTTTDSRGRQPPPHVRRLNNLGYDIIRFDRAPASDQVSRAELWLRDGLRELRQMGWRRIIVGGQSRGGWNALQMLNHADTADGIVAVVAASHGADATRPEMARRQHDDLRRVLTSLSNQPTRVVIVQFRDDPYNGNPDRLLELYADRLQPKIGALLLIDRPEGFTGHGAGGSNNFAARYSLCITQFLLGAARPATC